MSSAAGLEQRMGTDTQLWGLGDTACPRKEQDGSRLQVPSIALGYKGLSPCFMRGFSAPGGICMLGYSFSLLEQRPSAPALLLGRRKGELAPLIMGTKVQAQGNKTN